ncbi:MAG: cellulase family glycosylhydrolase [Planctomycetes bacterium]|nr:cellulase family glycosylhydrolase [Planctomycetota bacterium]
MTLLHVFTTFLSTTFLCLSCVDFNKPDDAQQTKFLRGINLPPTQGTTNAGSFLEGVYKYDYSLEDFERMAKAGFGSMRIAINAETAKDPKSLEKIMGFFEQVGNSGIICFFDTKRDGEKTHGDGKPNDLELLASCWKHIHELFADKPNISYELFNEPFGYQWTIEGATEYLSDMRRVIQLASLPIDRCIIGGVGYSSNVQLVAKAGWEGDLAYHFYPSWLPEGNKTQENYSNKIQHDLASLSSRVHLTEFGANLCKGDVYETYSPKGTVTCQDQNTLRGLHDALRKLKQDGHGIASSYLWHGWDNGDSYDAWNPKATFGAEKVKRIQGEVVIKN